MNNNDSLYGISVGDLEDVDYYYKNYGINMFQINASRIRELKRDNKEPYIVVHGSYSINLGRPWLESDWFIQQLIREIKDAHAIKAFGIVIHTGKSLKFTEAAAINNMLSALLHVHVETKEYSNVKILIETPAGQGTEILSNFEEYCQFICNIRSINKECYNRFGMCLDTAHMFASGSINVSDDDIANCINTISSTAGYDAINLIHLNNSSEDFFSKLDRHANINNGKMSVDGMEKIIDLFLFMEVPIVLETPIGMYDQNILSDLESSDDMNNEISSVDTIGMTSDYKMIRMISMKK